MNEALVQGMVAAMWSLEYGRHEDGLRILRDTIRLGHHQVSRLMREAGMGPRGLRGNNVRQPDGEDDWDQAGQSA